MVHVKVGFLHMDMNEKQIFSTEGELSFPVLYLRSIMSVSYAIFIYLDGQIVLWHDGPNYATPLNNTAILYERTGSAPTH